MMDTNTVSYIMRGKSPAARTELAQLRTGQIACISAITEGELRYRIAKRASSRTLTEALEGFLAKIQILAWGRDEAVAYGQLRLKQEIAGKVLGNLDMLIAAHAVAVGAVFVTNDQAFSQISDFVKIVNWAIDL